MCNELRVATLVAQIKKQSPTSIQLDGNRNVRRIRLSGRFLTSENIRLLNSMSALRKLRISCAKDISDEDWAHIVSLHQIETLEVGLLRVKELPETFIQNLHKLKNVQTMKLEDLQLPRSGLSGLEKMSALRHLSLIHVSHISDDDLARLSGLPRMKSLEIWYTDVSDADLNHLATFPSLEWVSLRGCSFTQDGINRLRVSLHKKLKIYATDLADEG